MKIEKGTIRQVLKRLRSREYPEIMNTAMRLALEDGTELEIFNTPSGSGDGHLIGSHTATRYRRGEKIASYEL